MSDWIEPKEARAAIERVAREALDEDRPWASRRAALAQASRPGNVRELAQAAALLVESLGTPRQALRTPYDLLLAWREGKRGKLPSMPGVLRKALAHPERAGLPEAKDRNDTDALEATVNERALRSGTLSRDAIPPKAPLEVYLRLAASLRATGSAGLCQWLSARELPPETRTGCRDGEPSGVVFSRPRPTGGFEVVWRGATREESLLLVWPSWLLHPILGHDGGTLRFIDAKGIWELPLDGTPPHLLLPGAFRHLAVSPDGRTVAAARRDTRATVVLLPDGATRDLPASSDAGLAFIDSDVLAVASGNSVSLASTQGTVREKALELGCIGALAARGTTLLAAVLPPCETGLYRVNIGEGSSSLALRLAEGPAGIAIVGDQTVVYANADGLWRWREGSGPERFAAGLTPGPG